MCFSIPEWEEEILRDQMKQKISCKEGIRRVLPCHIENVLYVFPGGKLICPYTTRGRVFPYTVLSIVLVTVPDASTV